MATRISPAEWLRIEGDGWVIYEEAAPVKSSGQSSEPAGQLPTKVTA
jgi:hypothetical protein